MELRRARWAASRRGLYQGAAEHVVLGVVPILITLALAVAFLQNHILGFDFHYAYWSAARAVLNGASPYVGPASPAVHLNIAFLYPPASAILLSPFGLLPHAVADWLFTALVFGAILASLRLAGVRDWRLYGLVALWPPVVFAWQNANVSGLLVLGLACVWRWRDRPAVAGIVTALLISLKPLAWPLGLWLLATRRYAAAGYALATGAIVNGASIAILGGGQLHRYDQLLAAATRVEERTGYSLISLATGLGATSSVASAIQIAVSAIVGLGCWLVARRGDDVRALLLCVATMLVATPILWTHYFALLLVPLALYRPRLSLVWSLPIIMVVAPETPPSLGARLVVLITGIAVICAAPQNHGLTPPLSSVWNAIKLRGNPANVQA